jgi:hypothetical protein
MNAADKQIKDWHEAEMKMSKHTPGPWSYRKVPRKQEWEINTGRCPNSGHESWTGMSVVFGCDDYPKMGKIAGEANARLIAAAPDLLEACKAMIDYYGSASANVEALTAARAAIAKATGEQ